MGHLHGKQLSNLVSIKFMRNLIEKREASGPVTKLIYVKEHSTSEENKEADALARRGLVLKCDDKKACHVVQLGCPLPLTHQQCWVRH